ncbi:MAG: helix-turn-helix domain-containing protein [Butyricicoccaceae bacterium]
MRRYTGNRPHAEARRAAHGKPGGGRRKARCEAKRNASATPEERQKIVELYEAGNSILAIARGQGRAYAVVSAILHASGVKMRSPGPKKKG